MNYLLVPRLERGNERAGEPGIDRDWGNQGEGVN